MGIGGSVPALRVDNVDIPENGMKEVTLNEEGDKILVARYDGKYFGIGHKCPHYGASLVNGALINGKVRCPWHGAGFDLLTGDIEDFPGLDSLASYKVKAKGKMLWISQAENSKGDAVNKSRRTKFMCKLANSALSYVIIGSGPAGLTAAQTLKEEGFNGQIIMITKDKYYPYDRTKLSKSPGLNWEDLKLRDKEFYQAHDIKLLTGSRVESINYLDKEVVLDDQTTVVKYDKLLIATGLVPRRYSPNIPGSDLKNIVNLYSIEDSKRIMVNSEDKGVIIVGSSFIAMELATSLKRRAKEIHIVSRSEFPYSAVLGPRVGSIFLKKLLGSGDNISYYPKDGITSFGGNSEGEVKSITLSGGKVIGCDLVIMAIGARPNTEWLEGSDLLLDENDKTIIVNEHMETNISGVYAAGDVVRFPLNIAVRKRASIAHWQVAQTHGKHAGLAMVGKPSDISRTIPFFWTNVAGANIRYAGFGEDYDEIMIFGCLEELSFCALYTKKGVLLAIATVNCDPLCSRVAEELKIGVSYGEGGYPTSVTQRFKNPPIIIGTK